MERKNIVEKMKADTFLSIVSPKRRTIAIALVCLACIASLAGASAPQAQAATGEGATSGAVGAPEVAIGTAFTYQGRLTDGNNPANGQYDFRFTLIDALSGGNQVGSPVTVGNQTVTQGLFTVSLDFGASAFAGDARYLQLEVRQTGGGTYTLLSPRQPLTPAPYALALRPGTAMTGAASASLLSLTNTTGQATGVSGLADNGSTAKGVYGESANGYGGYFQSTTGDGLSAIGADGVDATGTASGGAGVRGTANNGSSARGVLGISSGGSGVYGTSSTGYGGSFSSTSGTGVTASGGTGISSTGTATNGAGVSGAANSGTNAKGVYGTSSSGYGVYGTSTASNGFGVYGVANTGSTASGVYGSSTTGYGVYASGGTGVYATGGNGVYSIGTASNGVGVWGVANAGPNAKGVYGTSSTGDGVYGSSSATNGTGVVGVANSGATASGVYGSSTTGDGVFGTTSASSKNGVEGRVTGTGAAGVYGWAGGDSSFGVRGQADDASAISGISANGWAGYFTGNVTVSGSCCGAGEYYTRIDDPLDPENKYLSQSLVQSPEMLSMIDGNATLDAHGEAVVAVPAWFAATNRDFRYTLTSIGAPGPNLYIAQKVTNDSFKIAGGSPGSEASWQLTGSRTDPYALAHPIQPEKDKPADQQGEYLHPSLYGQPDSKTIQDYTAQSKP